MLSLCQGRYKMNDIFNNNYEEESEELPKTFKEYVSKIHKTAEREFGDISRGWTRIKISVRCGGGWDGSAFQTQKWICL